MKLEELINELREAHLIHGDVEVGISKSGNTFHFVSGIYEDEGAIVILGGGKRSE